MGGAFTFCLSDNFNPDCFDPSRSLLAYYTVHGMHTIVKSTYSDSPKTARRCSLVVRTLPSMCGQCPGPYILSPTPSKSLCTIRRLLDDTMQNELMTPYCTLTDHTLPITDIVCGIGLFPRCRILTSSIDHSVKVRNTPLGSQLNYIDALFRSYGTFHPKRC